MMDELSLSIQRTQALAEEARKRGYPYLDRVCTVCGNKYQTEWNCPVADWLKWEAEGRKPVEGGCSACSRDDGDGDVYYCLNGHSIQTSGDAQKFHDETWPECGAKVQRG